ncbi:MAG: type II toxin-antitoxin system VapC family toxin [Polyangiaceae bacterium]|nr:type II toxin-antitoxin system VapC family toxin [Polyangiaceae bacterium]
MTGILVDSNVLLDIATNDPTWLTWSSLALENAANEAPLMINALIYSEVSMGYKLIEELEAALPATVFRREPLPYEAAFLAGKAFLKYRRKGGARRSPLPDFYIGAHAAISGFKLLTRDAGRYRSYFPSVVLIAP